MNGEGLLATEIQIVQILLLASLVAVVTRRVNVPYTVALVLAGLAVALYGRLKVEMTPELVLAVFLPPLIFEAAFHIQYRDLRDDLASILTMAVPGVLLSTALIGGLLYLAGILSLASALLFGALISATDPVAVIATFRIAGAPKRLTTLLEGESLFNDGTAIVVFGIMVALAAGRALAPADGLVEFVRVSAGGVVVGLVLGMVAAYIIRRIDDYLIEITVTTAVAYGSFLVAEEALHVSGVLAVVMAGLVNGNLGSMGMSPSTRIVLFNFWEYIAFVSNSFIFILIGMNVETAELTQYLVPVLIAVVVVVVVRAVVVYSLGLATRLFKSGITFDYLHVMWWGGLRGAVSLALALSIPVGIGARRQLLAMAFGVVLFTLLAQATTISALLGRLGLTARSTRSAAYERLQGELLALRAARQHIERLHTAGALIPRAWAAVEEELGQREEQVLAAIDDLLAAQPGLRAEIVGLARREALRAQRAALASLAREGLLSDEVISDLQAQVDGLLEQRRPSEAVPADIPRATGA
jgi:CPA1 family monovalent cation:H+ antiporter